MSEFTDYDDLLKTYYNGQQVQDLTNTDNPFLAMLARKKMAGSTMPLPVIESYGQGVSASFSTAKTNQTNGNSVKFSLAATKLYQVVNIDRLTWKSSIGQNASFLDYMKYKIDGGLQGVGNAMSAYCFGSGTGSLAVISTINTGVITLVDADTVTYFEIGQVLQANATDGGTPRTAKGYVIALDYAAGTVTVSATAGGAAGTPTSWAAADFLLLDGTVNLVPPGLAGWIPFTAPTATTFKGVDRSVDPSRLAGTRYDGSSDPADEAIMNASSLLGRMGQKPDMAVVSTNVYNQLQKISQGKVIYVDASIAGIGFEGIRVQGAKGPISCFMDRNAPAQYGWLLSTKSWGLYSVGPAPELQVDDFGRLLRNADSDGYQAVVSSYWDIGCDAPVGNAIVKFAAS